jgi:hypothetical protein
MYQIASFFHAHIFQCPTNKIINYSVISTLSTSTSETLIIAFRGSVSLRNWQHNIDAHLVPFTPTTSTPPHVRVHHGFQRTWIAVRAKVLQAISEASKKRGGELALIFTGHSLGGAVAFLAGVDSSLSNSLIAPSSGVPESKPFKNRNGGSKTYRIRVVTFGAPRVGNKEFCHLVGCLKDGGLMALERVVHVGDLVPRLPSLVMGFRDAGTVYEVDEEGVIRVCKSVVGEKEEDDDEVKPFGILDDHLNYLGMRFGEGGCDEIYEV